MLEIIAIGWSDYRKDYCLVIEEGKTLSRWAIGEAKARAMAEHFLLDLKPIDGYFPAFDSELKGL